MTEYYCPGCAAWLHTLACGQCGGSVVLPLDTEGHCCPRAAWGSHTPQCRIGHTATALRSATAQVAALICDGGEEDDSIDREEVGNALDDLYRAWVLAGEVVGRRCCCWRIRAGAGDLATYLGRAAEAVGEIRHDVVEMYHMVRVPDQTIHDVNRHLFVAEQLLRHEGEITPS